jgi:putative protein-disulfide isomerase
VVTLTYLFDPLCGWCYGASPTIQKLGQVNTITLQLAPTGLFAGGGRTMDASFADYAWSNDMRIEKLTGQQFTEIYRTQVLGNVGGAFDSAAATLALTAVSLTEPQRELEALKLLQEARYVRGLDTSTALVVDTLLRDGNFLQAANAFASKSDDVVSTNAARMEHARSLIRTHNSNGIPTMIVTNEQKSRVLRGDSLYGSFDHLLKEIFL